MIDDELAAILKELGKRNGAGNVFELITLVDLNPGQISPAFGELIVQPCQRFLIA